MLAYFIFYLALKTMFLLVTLVLFLTTAACAERLSVNCNHQIINHKKAPEPIAKEDYSKNGNSFITLNQLIQVPGTFNGEFQLGILSRDANKRVLLIFVSFCKSKLLYI